MTLANIPSATRAYLRTFDLTAVVLTRDGRLTSTRDPSGRDATTVWWCSSTDVGRLVKAARKTGDLVGAAQRLGIVVTEHTTVMARATAAVEKIEQRLAQAQRNGDLGFINREFKRRRLEAAAQGRPFASYSATRSRLQHALASAVAGDMSTSLIDHVFGQ